MTTLTPQHLAEAIGELFGRGFVAGFIQTLHPNVKALSNEAAAHSVSAIPIDPAKRCSHEDCGARVRSKKLCSKHYQAARRAAKAAA